MAPSDGSAPFIAFCNGGSLEVVSEDAVFNAVVSSDGCGGNVVPSMVAWRDHAIVATRQGVWSISGAGAGQQTQLTADNLAPVGGEVPRVSLPAFPGANIANDSQTVLLLAARVLASPNGTVQTL